ncbi:hypothetical protein Scep_026745 [Stephania cephalantha]|uniref:Uncharacterized protein n=1 Tax=Stephania cephalantha TaxID=152367 RepID=A0AAP0EKT2_9MAGN
MRERRREARVVSITTADDDGVDDGGDGAATMRVADEETARRMRKRGGRKRQRGGEKAAAERPAVSMASACDARGKERAAESRTTTTMTMATHARQRCDGAGDDGAATMKGVSQVVCAENGRGGWIFVFSFCLRRIGDDYVCRRSSVVDLSPISRRLFMSLICTISFTLLRIGDEIKSVVDLSRSVTQPHFFLFFTLLGSSTNHVCRDP